MTQLWWFLTRSTGIVAWMLLTASVLWGLSLSSRRTDRPAWTQAMHRWVGGLSVSFLGLHLATLLMDSYIGFSVPQLLVPYLSTWKPFAVGLGILAMYTVVAVEATSLGRRYLPRRAWKAVHLTSFAGFWLASAHGILAGTDATNPLLFGTYAAAAVAVTGMTLYRILAQRRCSRMVRAAGGPAATARPSRLTTTPDGAHGSRWSSVPEPTASRWSPAAGRPSATHTHPTLTTPIPH